MIYELTVSTHAFTLIGALACLVLAEILLQSARTGQIGRARLAAKVTSIGELLAGVGIVAGITLFVIGPWSILTPWLCASLLLIAIMMVLGRRLVRPWQTRVRSALGTASGPEMASLINDRGALFGRIAFIGLFATIMALMVIKPGSF